MRVYVFSFSFVQMLMLGRVIVILLAGMRLVHHIRKIIILAKTVTVDRMMRSNFPDRVLNVPW